MKERPILFSGPMVRALLDGSKTQTRRALSPKVVAKCPVENGYVFGVDPSGFCGFSRTDRYGFSAFPLGRSLYGVPGDRLWVRETHAQFAVGNKAGDAPQCVAYRATCNADGSFDYVNNGDEIMNLKVTRWTPAIYMPRWASRITLEIIDVRVQRVQDISVEDARAEGVDVTLDLRDHMNPVAAFRSLWDSINGKRPGCSWDVNPWVWALTFKRVEVVHA